MIELLLTYKYLIIVPLAIIEGPIVSVLCGFLVTLGVFNIFVVFAIMVLGDIIGDGIYYYIGYSGKRFLPYFKISDEKLEKAETYFRENHKKGIFASKIVYGLGTAGLVAAGVLHVPYKKYFKTCALFSLAQSAIMLTIGIFFGSAYVVIEKYLNYYAAIASVVALIVILFMIIRKYKKKISQKIIS